VKTSLAGLGLVKNRRRLLIAATLFVLARLVFHALYWPAFEGPDEPFHLARVRAGLQATGVGDALDSELIGCVRSVPCSEDLARALGCTPFAQSEQVAAFNIVGSSCEHETMEGFESYPNYESHQPPLYYWAGVLALAATHALTGSDPLRQLLVLRLLSVLFVALALLFPIRWAARGLARYFYPSVLVALCFPGAAESLARAANDSLLFAWAALAIWELEHGRNRWTQPLLAAVGPLIKLTALPVVVLSVAVAFTRRGVRASGRVVVASLLFLPVQWIRGWSWGGTVELNAQTAGLHEGWSDTVVGLGRSLYTFLKTSLWLGGWSFFRAPGWIVALLGAGGIVLLLAMQPRGGWRDWIPNGLAASAAAVATLGFFVSHRMYFGQWGGVGGWYLWGWLPWLAWGAVSCFRPRENWLERGPRSAGVGVCLLGSLVVVVNLAWWFTAQSLYS
jgi:hypothetical protein